jgi:nitrate reductase gamma subunit
MVYLAFAVFFIGIIARLVMIIIKPGSPVPLQIFPEKNPKLLWALHDTFLLPTVRRHNPILWIFLMLFHICFLLLILGHLELIGEVSLLQIVPHEVFLGKGLIGLILSISLIFFMFRRFVSPNRDLSVPEDYYLLVLLFLTVIFGSQMDWARTWYEYGDMGVDEYREYLSSLFTFRPELTTGISYSGHAFMLVLHVFFANLFLMFFPFSKIMHSFFTFAVNKIRRG